MTRKIKFAIRPLHPFSPFQEAIIANWAGSIKATAGRLLVEPRKISKALRSRRLRELVYGKDEIAKQARATNIARLRSVAENRSGKYSSDQVFAATVELEKSFARLERQKRRDEARAKKESLGIDPSESSAEDFDTRFKRALAERLELGEASKLRDREAKLRRDYPWLYDDGPFSPITGAAAETRRAGDSHVSPSAPLSPPSSNPAAAPSPLTAIPDDPAPVALTPKELEARIARKNLGPRGDGRTLRPLPLPLRRIPRRLGT